MSGMGGFGQMMQGGIGATVTTVAGIVQGAMRMKAAKEQAAKAAELRKQAQYVPKEQLRPEYRRVLDAQTISATTGLSGRDIAENKIDQNISNMAKDAATIGSSGGASLAALAGAYGKGNEAKTNLMLSDAQERERKKGMVYQSEWGIGDKERDLELERQRKIEMILAEASALDKASMANKMGAHDVAANATMQGAGMFAGSIPQQSQGGAVPQQQQPTYTMPSLQPQTIPQQNPQLNYNPTKYPTVGNGMNMNPSVYDNTIY